MTIVVTKLNRANLAFVLKAREGNVGRYLTKKATFVTLKAKAQVGVKTGALQRSINWSYGIKPSGPFVRIGSPLSYAYLHHEGSRAHIITPKVKKALKFSSKGAIIITQRVRHPGTKPNKYLTDNLRWFR
jgi:hypothetical protein